MTKANLIAPYGGKLVNLVVDENEREELLAYVTRVDPDPHPSPHDRQADAGR